MRSKPAGAEMGNTINDGTFGATETRDCADGKSLNIGGSKNTLTVTGRCDSVIVGGDDNKITFSPEGLGPMRIRLPPKTALAALAAVGLLLPFGAPLPGSCLRTIGVAGAAPSPSCSGDLRECLRASADLRQTTFGGRYVTADDVARCMEAFRACTQGTLQGSSNPTATGAAPSDGKTATLPQRFGVTWNEDETAITYQCRVNGDTVNCSGTWQPAPPGADSWETTFAGTLSGLTATGTRTYRQSGSGECTFEASASNSMTYDFKSDGTVIIRQGPGRSFLTTCTGADVPRDYPASESTGTWSPIK